MIGFKVLDRNRKDDGIGEVATMPDAKKLVQVEYYLGPVEKVVRKVPVSTLNRVRVPAQTRCYYEDGPVQRQGRIIEGADTEGARTYLVRFPDGVDKTLEETEFHVRSGLIGANPATTLAGLAQESPFLFERRNKWLAQYYRQESSAAGLVGLVSSKVELFPHQVEVVRRVVSDPTMRYLLADEVGLGKTIEAGAVLRQVSLDAPEAKAHVFCPRALVHQWSKELEERFGLLDVEVHEHDELARRVLGSADVVVIDEAHQVVQESLFPHARWLTDPERTRHVLLLSATPVLHHEAQLLALLELLDPQVFRREDLAAFKAQLENRKELGRALLAITRTSRAAYLPRHIKKCADLLPQDPVVVEIAGSLQGVEEDQLLESASRLRIHLTETYRLHRRLLRTRRSVLIEQQDLYPHRSSEPPVCDDSSASRDLWLAVEDWRTRAAAFASERDARVKRALLAAYVALSSAVSSGDDQGAEAALRAGRKSLPGDADLASQILELTRRTAGTRAQAVGQLLRRLDTGRWVGFVSDGKRVETMKTQIARVWGGPILTVTEQCDAETYAETLADFRQAQRVLLLCDRRAEEGLNLQTANGLFLVDLPFAPMRVEQRIGRLDRLDRTKDIKCFPFVSLPDPSLAFDAAWHAVLKEGFGVFKDSISDLQFKIEAESNRLADIAFDGGPAALSKESERIASQLKDEREASAEQDILDGLYVGELRESALWSQIEEADDEEDDFGDALTAFVEGNLGLKAWRSDGGAQGTILKFQRRNGDQQPLIPAERLVNIGLYAAEPGTVNRSLASKRTELNFYRPGNHLVDELRDLALWDERGQAFAMWREAPFREPRLIFRATVRSGVALSPVEATLKEMKWDEVSKASLLRMILGWLPTSEAEVFLDLEGQEPAQDVVTLCSRPYGDRDVNLGKQRATALIELTGVRAWPELCLRIAKAAQGRAESRVEFQERLVSARREARDYFETNSARFRARERVAGGQAVEQAKRENEVLSKLVERVLADPRHKLDTFGVYVLSSSPICTP